jgi:hypothetical protein
VILGLGNGRECKRNKKWKCTFNLLPSPLIIFCLMGICEEAIMNKQIENRIVCTVQNRPHNRVKVQS